TETTQSQPSLSRLLAGAMEDLATLVQQQLVLFRIEIKEDLDVVRKRGVQLVVALGIEMIACVLFAFTLVYLMSALLPAAPLWVCVAVVTRVVAFAGGVVLAVAVQNLRNLRPLNDSIRTMEETIRWQIDPK